MTIFSIICLTALTATGSQETLDSFDYRDTAIARQTWHTSGGLPVEMIDCDGRRVLKLDGNLGDDSHPRRSCLDRKVKLDLEGVGEFSLRVATDRPDATEYVSLYFHSGGGWYSMSSGFRHKGWQTLHFFSSKAHVEGKPAGWNKIDAIRISFWRAGPQDAVYLLDNLASVTHEVAVIDAGKNATDTKTVDAAVWRIEKLLSAEGVGFDRIGEEAVAQGGLDGRKVAILPYNPQPSSETVAALEKFVAAGGRIFVCYSLSKRLGKLLGFEPDKRQRSKRPGHFAEIRFDKSIPGMPKSVKQASWNINSATPVAYNARVVAQWYDDKGKPSSPLKKGATAGLPSSECRQPRENTAGQASSGTPIDKQLLFQRATSGAPAMLLSDRGAFLTHIVLPDDPHGKQKMLLATLGRLVPAVLKEAYQTQLQTIEQIGHCCSLDELVEYIEANNKTAQVGAELESAQALLAEAELAAKNEQFHKAIASVGKAREMLDHAYLVAQPSPKLEARGWWNHSGTGSYAGDWERTMAELSASGFNMVFPNMLWGGVAHYPSDVLPRSKTYEKYGDQIAQCLAAAKKHGIEVHVWKVNHYLSHRSPKEFVDDLRRQGRTQMSADGQPKDWLCPSHPENTKLEADSMVEIVEKYDVDGLHFDYIRYPDGDHCYCDGCRERFEAASGKKVKNWPADCYRGSRRSEYRDWRCAQITKLVATVSKRAKAIRKDIKISAAVFSSYPACRDSIGQDWVHWAKSGYVDFLCPMDYTESDLGFQALIKNQHRLLGVSVPIYPGIGASATNIALSPARVVGQVHYARKLGAGGFTIFNLGSKGSDAIVEGFGLGAGKQKATPPHTQH